MNSKQVRGLTVIALAHGARAGTVAGVFLALVAKVDGGA